MKKRYLYSLLFGIPGFFVAVIISFVVFGVAAGVLWLYFFGDDPWPASTEKMLTGPFALTFLILWISSITIGFVIGKRLEKDPQLNKSHILISSGLTILFILVIVLQQFSVGNIGPKSDSVLYSDFCSLRGYSGSGMPPRDSGDRTCSCYDNLGNEALKVPLDGIDPDASE
jgi:heme/copper-type cytochrome/quinol oxidase subunit 3